MTIEAEVAKPAPAQAPAALEHAFYFRSGGRRLFATLHEPAARAARGDGWLFCSPFGEERGFSQRMAVEWARALCAAGHWVLRFDYRGYGDSEGWFEEVTADDHVADILEARAELERRAGVPCRGFWGLRLGGTLAAVAAARAGLDVALALWEPVVNGERYMDALLRATMVKEMSNTGRAPRTRDQLKAHMAAGGTVNVEGHELTDAAFRSIVALDLAKLGPARGPSLVVQLAKRAGATPRGELTELCASLGQGRLEVVVAPPPWQQNDEYMVGRDAPYGPTLDWVRGLPAAGAPAAAARAPAPEARAPVPEDRELRTAEGGVERAVSVPGPDGLLRGILHLPARRDPARPAVLFVTPGFNCRTARYRLYVKMARRLAERGAVVLRVDPHGIGDSDGVLDHPMVPDLYNAIEGGMFVADTRAAISWLESELGARQVLLVGLCGGATTSVRTGAVDERVAGAILSELPLRFTPRDATEEQEAQPAPLARAEADHFLRSYARKLFDPEAWRRFFGAKSDYRSLFASLRVALAKRLLPRRVKADDAWFRERLGPFANLTLVRALEGCLERRMRILCVFGATRNSWFFAEIWPALEKAHRAGARRLGVVTIQDADPGFSLPPHTREVLEKVTAWVEQQPAA